jgi:hypothetical protein
MSGLASYSSADASQSSPASVQWLKEAGYKLNWDAHRWMPYQGMALPPVTTRTETWQNDFRAGNHTPRADSSVAAIDAYLWGMAANNWTALAFMSLTSFGRNMTGYLTGALPALDPAASWRDAPAFMRAHRPGPHAPG